MLTFVCSAMAQRLGEIARLPAEQKRRYAAVAEPTDIDEIHRREGVTKGKGGTCPHASKARSAAKQAQDFADVQTGPGDATAPLPREGSSTRKQTFPLNDPRTRDGKFDYEAFYKAELDKKHSDKSYRCACSPSILFCFAFLYVHMSPDTSTTSIAWPQSSLWPIQPRHRTKSQSGAPTITWAWVATLKCWSP